MVLHFLKRMKIINILIIISYFISIVSLVNELYDLPSLGLDYEFTQNKVIIDTKPKNEG